MKVDVINYSNNELPKYETPRSAGMDARASFSKLQLKDFKRYGVVICKLDDTGNRIVSITLQPGSRCLVPTDLYVAIPEGYEIQVRPRSGLALKQGITVLNTPGTIDSDYRGNVGVILVNHGLEDAVIEEGERICQLVLNKVERIEWNEVLSLDETDRKGGFGHTGVK